MKILLKTNGVIQVFPGEEYPIYWGEKRTLAVRPHLSLRAERFAWNMCLQLAARTAEPWHWFREGCLDRLALRM